MGSRRVFVLGAGFTRAFYPRAPLMLDDYGADDLLRRFAMFPAAKRVLELEIGRNGGSRINIERLMTRLDSQMPYDDLESTQQFALLLSELRRSFLLRLSDAKRGIIKDAELAVLATYCVHQGIDCISFNYDDFLDQKLFEVSKGDTRTEIPHWHPDGGYGFFCRPADATVRDGPLYMEQDSMLLLKLHGSINWRAIRGRARPYSVDAIVHFEPWYTYSFRGISAPPSIEAIESHLNPEELIVPPVLAKSALTDQLWLNLVWAKAREVLSAADNITFVGYSLPLTDIAASFLFTESVRPGTKINIVNFKTAKGAQSDLAASYLSVFPWLTAEMIDYRGALEWTREVTQSPSAQTN